MIEQAIQAFVTEAAEILADLETRFLELEDSVTSSQIDEIFRALHTVKGSGGMFGYTALARFTHHFENAYELVRSGILEVNHNLIDLSLKARDLMVDFLDLGGDGPMAEALLLSEGCQAIVQALHKMTGRDPNAEETRPTQEGERMDPSNSRIATYQIQFRPHERALQNGMRPDLLLNELRTLGDIIVRLDTSLIPGLADIDPANACLSYSICCTTAHPRAAVEDVFIFADDADLVIEEIAVPPSAAEQDMPTAVPTPIAGSLDRDEPQAARTQANRPENIRVSSSRLDDMMDSLGELVIAQARLEAIAETLGDATLESVVEEVQRLVVGLRDATLSIRMLPIETVFGKFRRVIRDLSTELGKDVRLVTEGGETEVDKNVIDRIGDPLVHMIRNSVDHGLETAEIRRAAGKPERGTVRLAARQEGGEILISIEDNGAGLNTDGIRKKAIERGIIAKEDDILDKELQHLIFSPGFSTAETVTSVSGRGVGMDAVKTTIDSLGGSVDVVSRKGRGTRITLRLPVTMAIIDGLRVRLGERVYVIPLSAVEECVEMSASEGERNSGRTVLQIRQELIPYLELSELFDQHTDGGTHRRVVVVRVDGERIGLVVDDILGQSQTVIKSLSIFHNDIPGLGGATILGDGSVALIMDVVTLVRWEISRSRASRKKVA